MIDRWGMAWHSRGSQFIWNVIGGGGDVFFALCTAAYQGRGERNGCHSSYLCSFVHKLLSKKKKKKRCRIFVSTLLSPRPTHATTKQSWCIEHAANVTRTAITLVKICSDLTLVFNVFCKGWHCFTCSIVIVSVSWRQSIKYLTSEKGILELLRETIVL